MQAGWTLDARPAAFKTIIFQNTLAVPITITFYAGNCSLTYSPVLNASVVTEAGTFTKGTGVINATPNVFNGQTTVAGVVKTRKQIVITNLDAANALVVNDANGNEIAQIAAGQVWTVESSGSFTIVNAYGINYCVGELFYA